MADNRMQAELCSSPAPVAPLMFSARLTISIWMFLACMLTYLLRLNLGFAMVCMIKSDPVSHGNSSATATLATSVDGLMANGPNFFTVPPLTEGDVISNDLEDSPDVCIGDVKYAGESKNHSSDKQPGEFTWEKSLRGALLGAFFYGYIVTQVPAGWLCDKIGGKIVIGVGLGMVTFLTLLLPEAARLSPYAMLAVRVLQGMFAAVSFPAIHSIVGNWAPPTERGFLMSLSYSGMYVGTLVTFPLCGLLCDYGFAGGWPSIFYVTGMLGVVYLVSHVFLVYDGYENHPRISNEERMYLEKTLVGHHGADSHLEIPWLQLIKSGPVWGIILAHLCCNWGLYTLAINLPTYMKEVLRFDVKQNGFLSSLPYLCTLILTIACGKMSDLLQKRKVCTLTVLRKSFTAIGMLTPAICMLIMSFLHCEQRYIAVGVVTTCQAMTAFAYSDDMLVFVCLHKQTNLMVSVTTVLEFVICTTAVPTEMSVLLAVRDAGGFFYNHVDLSPSHAGILMGITNTFGTVPGIVSPLLVGILTPNGTHEEWTTLFYIGTGAYLLGTISFLILGSGERQPWSYSATEIGSHNELQSLASNNAHNTQKPAGV